MRLVPFEPPAWFADDTSIKHVARDSDVWRSSRAIGR